MSCRNMAGLFAVVSLFFSLFFPIYLPPPLIFLNGGPRKVIKRIYIEKVLPAGTTSSFLEMMGVKSNYNSANLDGVSQSVYSAEKNY